MMKYEIQLGLSRTETAIKGKMVSTNLLTNN